MIHLCKTEIGTQKQVDYVTKTQERIFSIDIEIKIKRRM